MLGQTAGMILRCVIPVVLVQ